VQPKKHKKTNSRPNKAVWTVFVNCAHWRGSTLAIYKTVLIIFPLNLQTITLTLDVVKWRWGVYQTMISMKYFQNTMFCHMRVVRSSFGNVLYTAILDVIFSFCCFIVLSFQCLYAVSFTFWQNKRKLQSIFIYSAENTTCFTLHLNVGQKNTKRWQKETLTDCRSGTVQLTGSHTMLSTHN